MSNIRVVVTSPSFSRNDDLREEICTLFPGAVLNEKGLKLEGEALVDYMGDAEGAIVGLEEMSREVLSRCRQIRIISKYGVGLDNVDLEYCRERNVAIGWTPGVNKVSVAEMTLAFMIMLGRNLFRTSVQLKDGVWNKSGGFDLHGKTVGIIGVGNVGKELVRLLKPFECSIMVNDIIDQSIYYRENGLIESPKKDIFETADFVTLHAPLTDLTRNMINRDSLSVMKKNAFLINTARGPIVELQDLKWALNHGVISGAAIDVYDKEPPTDVELLGLENLICTPHIGGNSYESVLSMGRSAIGHLRDFFYTRNTGK